MKLTKEIIVKRRHAHPFLFFLLLGGVLVVLSIYWARHVLLPAHWSIGYYTGRTIGGLVPAAGVQQPVLSRNDITDVDAEFVADPFVVAKDSVWYMFFEILDRRTKKGCIGYASSADLNKWEYHGVVLREPFHLSYPYVFEWRGKYYMVPESHEARSVRLYVADPFPTRWRVENKLVDSTNASDPSIFNFNGAWWLFFTTGAHDTLHLFYADDLHGPWVRHPQSPIIKGDPNIARCGGRVILENGIPIRFAQDDYPDYGNCLRAFEIVQLSRVDYIEREMQKNPILEGVGTGWNAFGMHHIDLHRSSDTLVHAWVDGLGRNKLPILE